MNSIIVFDHINQCVYWIHDPQVWQPSDPTPEEEK